MRRIFGFGETVVGYDIPVLNEREVRAAAGLQFFFALVSFMNSWLLGNFHLTRLFVIAFLIDFTIRVFVNPRFSPSMILGRLAVCQQTPEYVGAPQKRFAWSVGLVLAALMYYLIVLNQVIGPFNLAVCATCLTLMFFESAFGICLACKVYNLFARNKATLCPGGVCAVGEREEIQKVGFAQVAIVVAFLAVISFIAQHYLPPIETPAASAQTGPANDNGCTPPGWAVSMGHADMWKLHHNCK